MQRHYVICRLNSGFRGSVRILLRIAVHLRRVVIGRWIQFLQIESAKISIQCTWEEKRWMTRWDNHCVLRGRKTRQWKWQDWYWKWEDIERLKVVGEYLYISYKIKFQLVVKKRMVRVFVTYLSEKQTVRSAHSFVHVIPITVLIQLATICFTATEKLFSCWLRFVPR